MEEQNGGFFKSSNLETQQIANENNPEISWSSLEHVSEKSIKWYLILIFVTIIISGLVYLVTKDLISTIVFVLCGFLIFVYSLKKPRNIEYKIKNNSLMIQNKTYFLSNFRAFSIFKNKNTESLVLVPLKRFVPRIYINLNQDISAKVIDKVNQIIPAEKYTQDLSDKIIDLIRL